MEPILLSAVAAIFIAIGGFVAVVLSRRKDKENERFIETGETLTNSLAAQAQIARARALEIFAQKFPSGLDATDFVQYLEKLSSNNSAHQVINPQDKSQLSEQQRTWSVVEDLINGYHRQALDQARAQFWFSAVAATVGFGWIIYTGTQIEFERLTTVFQTIPGIIMEAVAFLFFRQAEATRERATALYDRLRTDNQQSQSVSIVDSIDDALIRSAVKAQLSLHMAGLAPTAIDIAALTASARKEEELRIYHRSPFSEEQAIARPKDESVPDSVRKLSP